MRIGKRLAELTDGAISSINQNIVRLAEWVHDRLTNAEAREIMSTVYKEEAEDEDDEALVEKTKLTVKRGVVERLLDYLRAKDCDDAVLMEVLELREFGASAAPKKFQAILDSACRRPGVRTIPIQRRRPDRPLQRQGRPAAEPDTHHAGRLIRQMITATGKSRQWR